MKPGLMRHDLTFQLKTETQNTFGDTVETWADSFTVPAEVLSSFTLEVMQARKRNALVTLVFRIRYRTGIDPDIHRVKFTLEPNDSPVVYQYFNIFPPRHDGRRRFTLIDGQAIDPDAI